MSGKITLTVTKGKLKGQQFSFDSRTTCIIGRARDCNIRIPNDEYHRAISRYHCLLDINPPDICIRDFGSLHGTYVNQQCIGKRKANQSLESPAKMKSLEYDLQDGDEIQLSNTVFKVSISQQQSIPSTWLIPEPANLPPQLKLTASGNLGVIENYTKLNKLGTGGCGEVYLARNEVTQELVALKTLLPKVAVMPQMKEMFLREARNAKRLDHPNLVKLKDYCFADGIFFFTMEYCDRGSVLDLMQARGGKLNLNEASQIILQILAGLHYAHTENNLVHRDIKPGNIFLTVKDNQLVVKLGDYGLAKAFDLAGLSGQTLTGTKMGTPVFMPRQQVLDFKYVQPDVDIWATAATFYYMLTAEYPRNFAGIEPMLAILKTQPVPIRDRNPDIPEYLADLIDLALKDYPELHFKSAMEFKNTLLAVL